MEFQEYLVDKIFQVTSDIFSFRVIPVRGNIFSYIPGQFAGVINPSQDNLPHYLSMTSVPGCGYLEFYVRIFGPWTKYLSREKAGKKLYLVGPYGKFIFTPSYKKTVFVAGGVGISPFISILRFLRERKKRQNIMLIYADRNPDSILFTEEISAFTKEKYLVKAVRVFSEYNPSGKFRNLINKEFISREITIPEENDFFICGSPNFVLNIRKILTEMGVNEENLQLELLTRKDRMLINKVITEKMNVITREKENFIIYQN